MKHGLGIAGLALALVAFVSVPPAAAPSNLSFGATAPGGIWNGISSNLVPFGTRNPYLPSFATLKPLGNLGSFAVLAESGHFGVGGLAYESPTPYARGRLDDALRRWLCPNWARATTSDNGRPVSLPSGRRAVR